MTFVFVAIRLVSIENHWLISEFVQLVKYSHVHVQLKIPKHVEAKRTKI